VKPYIFFVGMACSFSLTTSFSTWALY